MSALPDYALASLRAGLSALNVQTLSYQKRTAGVWATAVTFSGIVTADGAGQLFEAPLRSDQRTITVRPTAAVLPVSIGDRIIFESATFVINAVDGTDVQRITAVLQTMNGVQSTDGLRFQGT